MVERYTALPVLRAALALALAEAGDAPGARRVIDGLAPAGFTQLRRDAGWLVGAAILAQACASVGEAGRAAELRDALARFDGSR